MIVKFPCISQRTLEAVSHPPPGVRGNAGPPVPPPPPRPPVCLPPPAPHPREPASSLLPPFHSRSFSTNVSHSLRFRAAPFLCTPALSALHGLSPCFARKKYLPAFVEEQDGASNTIWISQAPKWPNTITFIPLLLARGPLLGLHVEAQIPRLLGVHVSPAGDVAPVPGRQPASCPLPPGLRPAPGWPRTHARGTGAPCAHASAPTPCPTSAAQSRVLGPRFKRGVVKVSGGDLSAPRTPHLVGMPSRDAGPGPVDSPAGLGGGGRNLRVFGWGTKGPLPSEDLHSLPPGFRAFGAQVMRR